MPLINVPRVIDDHDGSELPADTKPTNISYMGQRYALYLSDDNAAKLFDFLHTFTKDSEPVFDVQKDRAAKATAAKAQGKADAEATKEENNAIRHWVNENNIVLDKPLAERGRISAAYRKAWADAGSPGIPS